MTSLLPRYYQADSGGKTDKDSLSDKVVNIYKAFLTKSTYLLSIDHALFK